MPRIPIRRVIVDRQTARGCVLEKLATRERQQRTDQTTAAALRDAGESRRSAAAQCAQHDRLDLIVLVVRGHEVCRAATALHFAQPGVPRAARLGL